MAKIPETIVIRARSRGSRPACAGTPGRPRTQTRWGMALVGLIGLATACWAGWITAVGTGPRGPIAGGMAWGRAPVPGVEAGRSSSTAAAIAPVPCVVASQPRDRAPDEVKPSTGAGDVDGDAPRPAEAPAPPPRATEPAGPPGPGADPVRPPAGDDRSLGRELFARNWLPQDPRCHGGDGLGPVYNATSCLECHGLGGPGGAGPASRNVELATGMGYDLIASPDKPANLDGLSSLLSGNTIQGRVRVMLPPARTDLARIHPGFRTANSAVLHRFGADPNYSRWRANVRSIFRERGVVISITARNPLPLFGAGLIDALPDPAFLEAAARQLPEIRGRVHRLNDGPIGRFGWKAQVANLEEFVLRACANELGLEVPGHHQAGSPLNPDAQAPALDLTADECQALVAYVRSLPPPVVIDPPAPQESLARAGGRKLFQSIGCAGCHTPDLGTIQGIYSDLLLHEMGPSLSDPAAYYGDDRDEPGSPGSPTVSEWRTPPLWGFRDSGPYLHDGRAQTLDEAVAWHGGQGATSAYRFRALTRTERSHVRAFLSSLAAPAPAVAPQGLPAAAAEVPVAAEPAVAERKLDAIARAAAGRTRHAATRHHAVRPRSRAGLPRGALDGDPGVVRKALDSPPDPVAAQRHSILGGMPTRDPAARPAGSQSVLSRGRGG